MGYGYRGVDMSSSHTETFTESLYLLPLLFFAASQGPQGVPAINLLVVGGLIGVGFVVSVWLLWSLLKRRRL